MLKENLANVEKNIEQACKNAGRNRNEVTLIAVSKTKPVEMLQEIYDENIRDFGENKVQELCSKMEQLPSDIHWHMIGHLQRNKVKYIVGKVELIHSVDTYRLAEEINIQAKKQNVIVPILVEVNIAHEESKFGISAEDAILLVEEISRLENIRIKGLMTIAPLYFFFGWGVEGLLLYPVIGDWVFELSVGYLMQLVVAVTVFCALFRRMMEQVGFPPREHWLKYATWLVLYIVILYGTGWFFTQIAGKIVLLRLPILSYSIFCLLLGAGLYAIHFWRYGKDPRLSARI